jgi:hypothetical protein
MLADLKHTIRRLARAHGRTPVARPVMQSANVSSSAAGPRTKFVGVVANGRYLTLAEAGRPYVFVPLEQNFRGASTVRGRGVPGLALAIVSSFGISALAAASLTAAGLDALKVLPRRHAEWASDPHTPFWCIMVL